MRSSVRLQAEQAVVGAWLAVALVAMTAVSAAAQSAPADGRADINVEVSSSDMIRRTAIYTAAGQGLNRAADAGLDALFGRTGTRRTRDVFARLGRIWFVNLPIAALAQGAAHDSGHFARLAEFGVHAGRRQMEQWPWPVPIAISVELVPPPESFDAALAQGLAVLGGGEQGSTLTKQRLADQIYQRDATGYFDWMLVAYASLDYPIYAWSDLSGHIEAAFERGPGDFLQYAEFMTFLGPNPGAEAQARNEDRLRRGAWLNLADYSLWQALIRVGQYVATGERRAENATVRIGALRLVPSAYATLGSLGPERGAEVRFVASSLLTRLNVRYTTTPDEAGLWGAGAVVRSRDPRRLRPEGNVDVWQRPGKGAGVRVEAGSTRTLTIAGHALDVSARIGYKTEGYLTDAPMRATVLAAFSLSTRF
jgi:hypothetical protein